MNYVNHDKFGIHYSLFSIFYKIFSVYVKISKDSSAKYYRDNKEGLQKKARRKYQSLSKEEKWKKQQYQGVN